MSASSVTALFAMVALSVGGTLVGVGLPAAGSAAQPLGVAAEAAAEAAEAAAPAWVPPKLGGRELRPLASCVAVGRCLAAVWAAIQLASSCATALAHWGLVAEEQGSQFEAPLPRARVGTRVRGPLASARRGRELTRRLTHTLSLEVSSAVAREVSGRLDHQGALLSDLERRCAALERELCKHGTVWTFADMCELSKRIEGLAAQLKWRTPEPAGWRHP